MGRALLLGCFLMGSVLGGGSALWAQDPIDEFRLAYRDQNYVRAFDLLARLRRVSQNPTVFGKLMGVTAYRLGGALYAMYLLESYAQQVQKAPEIFGNLITVARSLMLEPYVAQTFYEDLVAFDILPNYVRAALAPEVVLEALERDDLGRTYDYLPYLRATRKGLYVGGVFASLNGTQDVALKYFQRIANLPITRPQEYHLHLLAQLGLGRVYYEIKDWDRSASHYGRIPRSSKLWFHALAESSWAHFQNGELNLALGKLHSFISPFLLNRLYPEALVLRTMVLHELCKYAEMSTTLAYFYEVYRPISGKMLSLVEAFQATPSVRAMAAKLLLDEGESALLRQLPLPIRLHFVHHPKTFEYQKRLAFIRDNERESIRLTYRLGSQADRESADLKRYINHLKAFVITDYGAWLTREISDVSRTLAQSLEQASLVEIELTLGEQEAVDRIEDIIRQARSAERILAIAGPGHEFWPFRNEFWKDEIGYYVVNTPSSCAKVP